MAESKSDIDSRLDANVQALVEQAKVEAEQRKRGEQVQWMSPDLNGYDRDLFNVAGMSKPFDRTESNEAFVAAVEDPDNSGVSGDLIVTTTQIDWLACMERAYRSRHTMRRPRAMAHATGRKRGHGHDRGPIKRATLEYLRGLLQQTKAGRSGDGGDEA